MEHLTDEVIKDLKRDELLNHLYDTEVEIFSIKFSFTHDGIPDNSEVREYMTSELKRLEDLHDRLMVEVYNRSKD
jgi:hypothetical protein